MEELDRKDHREMKHIIIGTAGHVDHGKTCLTRALTGTDTDRLKEEKKRGITIEIGFAKLTLPNGQTASIIDVPGHERLIRNMLVGAGGIDVVLLVIAADEGVMPQTQEHLEILSLLGVTRGIIVLTKVDMVDADWLEMVTEDIREHMAGTFLEGAPILPVSAVTGCGIEELKQSIVTLIGQTPARTADMPVRLPVDRSFSVKGFGTVVTGTLMDGALHSGDTVMVYPQQKLAKVRELQNHDVSQSEVEAGMRVAINLTGVERQELTRGCTIAQPGSMLLSRRIAVELELTQDTQFEVRNASQLHFYQGTQELLCKVRLLNANLLRKGERGYAELTFEEELSARNLDRFIVRFFSPMTTVGGGVILDMNTPRLKRNDVRVLNRLGQLKQSPKTRVRQMIYDAGYTLPDESALNRVSGLPATTVKEALETLEQGREVVRIGTGLIAADVLNTLWFRTESLLRAYHDAQPLKEGMPLGELREKAFSGAQKSADAILRHLALEQKLRVCGSSVALFSFRATYPEALLSLKETIYKEYKKYGLEPPTNSEAAEQCGGDEKSFQQVAARMQQDGQLIALTPQTMVLNTYCRTALRAFVEMFQQSETVALGEFRTKLGVSRKYAQMYLDYFDRCKISKLVGDRRVLLNGDSEAAFPA